MKVLPFFTSTAQRDAERVSSWDARLCPRQNLLPFQIQRDHVADTYLASLVLVDCDGNETDIFNYPYSTLNMLRAFTNAAATDDYETFNTKAEATGETISTAIESGSAEAWCYSNEFPLATGDSTRIDYIMTLNSGDLPTLYLGKSDGTLHSTGVVTLTGSNTVFLNADANDGGNTRLLVKNQAGDDTSFKCQFGYTSDIISKNTLEVDEYTTYDFITYNGTPMNTWLPYGTYYLRTSDGITTWYSDWFTVRDLQPTVLTAWGADTYDTFVTTLTTIGGLIVLGAIDAGGGATAVTNTFAARIGEIFIVVYDLGPDTGERPYLRIVDSSNAVISNAVQAGWGINSDELTITATDTAAKLQIYNTGATAWEMASISLRRKAGDFVHLEFTNTNDINTGAKSVLYQKGFTQQCYFETQLNNPQHEVTEVGEVKDGVFEAEKIVDSLIYNIVSYEPRTLCKAMRVLPMHDTIKILDEVGNEYLPSQGNVKVAWDPTTFDTYTLRINFNEDGDTWTSNMDDIT